MQRKHHGGVLLYVLLAAPALPTGAQQLHHYSLDGRVTPTAGSTNVAFLFSRGTMNWVVNSITITIDGTPHPATLVPDGAYTRGDCDWDSSQAPNPSRHTAYATADIQRWSYYPLPGHWVHMSVSSLSAAPYGDGWDAEFAIADMRLASLEYINNIALKNHYAPLEGWEVPTPQVTWDVAGAQTRAQPAAYVRAAYPTFALDTFEHGTATTGVTFTLTASAGSSSITVYQTPGVVGYTPGGTSLMAQNALWNHVRRYDATLDDVQFYVQFTRLGWQPAGPQRSSYPHALYATLDTPTGPMTTPWVGVLEHACTWAGGADTATGATTLLTQGVFLLCEYIGQHPHVTDQTNSGETFHLRSFLVGGEFAPAMQGQCSEFADYLMCLSHALGARPLACQRSALWADSEVCRGYGWRLFQTVPVTLARAGGLPVSQFWYFHQWGVDSSVFDGCVRIGGTTSPADLAGPAIGSAYFDAFVYALASEPAWWQYLEPPRIWSPWNPQTPFTPTIAN